MTQDELIERLENEIIYSLATYQALTDESPVAVLINGEQGTIKIIWNEDELFDEVINSGDDSL